MNRVNQSDYNYDFGIIKVIKNKSELCINRMLSLIHIKD